MGAYYGKIPNFYQDPTELSPAGTIPPYPSMGASPMHMRSYRPMNAMSPNVPMNVGVNYKKTPPQNMFIGPKPSIAQSPIAPPTPHSNQVHRAPSHKPSRGGGSSSRK